MALDPSQIPVVILCGGLGTRLAEETVTKPKPMVEIGGRPILWHIMKRYSAHGFQRFILCLGYRGDLIRDFFLNYDRNTHDIRISIGTGESGGALLDGPRTENWEVTLAETGASTLTGGRVKKIEKYIDSDVFMLTYGDGVCDVDIEKLLAFHEKGGRIGTVTGVRPPSRFGELLIEGDRVAAFAEKPEVGRGPSAVSGFINGGFFVFQKEFFKYLQDSESCVLERQPLERLAKDGQLQCYRHDRFWQCMDTMRDVSLLRELWDGGTPPWRNW